MSQDIVADELETGQSKLEKLKKARQFAYAWGKAHNFEHEMQEFMKNDPVMRYAGTTNNV